MFNLPPKPPHIIHRFLNEYKPLVYKFLIGKIKIGIQEDLDKIDLFRWASDNRVAIIKKPDYEIVLEDAIKVFIKAEDYESAASARDILKLSVDTNINRLLDENIMKE